MPGDGHLTDLLLRWQELQRQGHNVSAEELCQDTPELLDSLREHILALRTAMVTPGRLASLTSTAPALQPEPLTVLDPSGLERPAGEVQKTGSDWPIVKGYEILGELGRGGMGVVYKARQKALCRIVALKVILSGPHAGPEELVRFRSEVEAIARLEHPNLVHVYEIAEQEGYACFSMEFVDGGSLQEKIAAKPQPPRQAAQLVEALARAMHAVHQHGIVHRDLKPANVLLTSDGIPKVTDFGLAKRLDVEAGPTLSGQVLGTPGYMAPEQAAGQGKHLGPAADIYALGAILYAMLSGRPPFQAATPWETIAQVTRDDPVSLRHLQRNVPQDLETICLKCLHKEPARRYSSALALADDLRRFLAGEPIQARPVGLWERAVKWVKRRPAAAALLAVSCAAVLALLVGGLIYNTHLRQALQESRDHAEEGRKRLVRLQVAQGTHLLDQGDWFGALVWFTEALQLDAGKPDREAMHRLRIAAVRRRCPRLLQLWSNEGPIRHVQFSRDGRRLLTVSDDGSGRVQDTITGEPLYPPRQQSRPFRCGAISPDGEVLLTGSEDHTARLWVVSTGQPRTAPLPHGGPVVAASFNRDGRHVLTVAADGAARIWDAATGKLLTGPLRHKDAIRYARFSPDESWVVTASADQTARVWNAATGEPVTPPLQHPAEVCSAAFLPDGKCLFTACMDGIVRSWDMPGGKPGPVLLRHRAAVLQVSCSADGSRLVTASDDRTACIWDASTGELVAPPLRHGSGIATALFSPDGSRVVTASSDNTARVWDATTGEALTPLLKHNGSVRCAGFSPDGRWAITAGNDATARLWDLTAGLTAVAGSESSSKEQPGRPAAQWPSPDGRRLVTVEGDRGARLRDAGTGELLGPLLFHGSTVVYAAFNSDGSRLVTTSDDNTARIWAVPAGELLTQPLAHNGTVRCAAFSPDGQLVVTAGDEQTGRVWDAATGEPVTPPLPFRGNVQRVFFNPAEDRVGVVGVGGRSWTWELPRDDRPTADLLSLAQVLAGSRLDSRRGLLRHGSNQGNTRACAICRRKPLGPEEIGQNWPPRDERKVLPKTGPF